MAGLIIRFDYDNQLVCVFANCGCGARVGETRSNIVFVPFFYILKARGNVTTATTHKNCKKHHDNVGQAACPSSDVELMVLHHQMHGNLSKALVEAADEEFL